MDVVQVIHDDDQAPPRVAAAQPAERLEDVGNPLAPAEDPAEAIAVHVVEAEEVPHALEPAVGGPYAPGLARRRPGRPAGGLELPGPPFVEADYRRARRAAGVEPADDFFFRSNAGSCDVFHVRIRCARIPAPRSDRRTHSSQNGGI